MAVNGDRKLVNRTIGREAGVAIVARQPATRRRLASLLAAEGIEIVARCAAPDRVFKVCAADPSVIVVLHSDPVHAPASIRALKHATPEVRVVLIADEGATGRDFRAALRALPDAVVYLDRLDEALLPSVRAVLAEQLAFPRRERLRMELPALSHREKQVLRLAAQGRTNDEIASRLYLATSTVKSHLTSAFAKLAVRSRSEAAAVVFDPDEPVGRALLAAPVDEVSPLR